MLLCNLLNGINVICKNVYEMIDIEYIARDHRKVQNNYMFIAINGNSFNGNDYIDSALEKGAVVIITDSVSACRDDVPYVLVENVRTAVALIWSNYYGNPAKNIQTIAITGTNGKSSTAKFLYNIFVSANIPCGLISTIEWLANGEEIELLDDISYAMTTPDPEALYYLYNKMKEKSIKVVILEVSSHALVQNRLEGINVEIGAFTNLSREHLDYHKTMEEYFQAKLLLAKKSKRFIVNYDDFYGNRVKKEYEEKTLTVSTEDKADFYATNIICNTFGCEYELHTAEKTVIIKSNLVGKHNVYNSMIAFACAYMLGVDEKSIKQGIEQTKIIKGRLEKYKDRPIYIDYAHTPLAMETVMKEIRGIEPEKRLIVLFGCGGQRDKGKRAQMAEISAKYADFTVITDDNPRNEPPNEIIADILIGLKDCENYIVIPNRKRAIEYACRHTDESSTLLLLGKGHETYEICGEKKSYFDERMILDEVFFGS